MENLPKVLPEYPQSDPNVPQSSPKMGLPVAEHNVENLIQKGFQIFWDARSQNDINVEHLKKWLPDFMGLPVAEHSVENLKK